ncbi:PREDICTED: aldose 1-epimerase isoform X2 [Tarenaya hassleriana]|uniref:aldose 1-epimerase isoform X1 n=1 Tax=Tarenaya hassleriana TaxID=28532 RepID=UPI00053C5325|nr:PREDICTED: aldose 1-epimerase isoform X1 [Tarenaya hassleriana]XP_010524328.1 PREDICTED: aldose 1-epimerase isoform X2 [Tarenaya hassleriana]
MARFPVLLCFVLLVTFAVVISVSYADHEVVKSKDLEIQSEDGGDKPTKVKGSDIELGRKNNQDVDSNDDDDDDDDDDKEHKNKKKGGHDDDDDDKDGKDKNKGGRHHGDEVNADEHESKDAGTYELKKGNMTVKFTNWGASIMSLILPDKHGKMGDIVLGYDSVKDYMNDTVYFGATVGRVANRIGKARFKLNGKTYKTVANEGKNTLHGGKRGFGDVVWSVTKRRFDGNTPFIVFTYTSPDGDQGFPGELRVKVTYKLVGTNELRVEMEAKPKDKATPVNLAHHTYWNLGGHDSGDILSEQIRILGSRYTPVDGQLIPTGKTLPVQGTPFDFLHLHPIKDKIKKLNKGYDINICLEGKAKRIRKVVELVDKRSGRKMELSANQPGLQFYTGGQLKNVKGKNGAVYKAYAGLCLETQGYPDSVNYKNFPSQIVQPGKTYKHVMHFKFSIVS